MTADERSADQSPEAQVRAYWEPTAIGQPTTSDWDGEWRLVLGHNVKQFIDVTPDKCWDAALAFTLEHQRKVAELGIEVALMNGLIAVTQSQNDKEVYKRILARLQAALSELRLGTRGAA